MTAPRVSVVIPTYNYARFVGNAVDSILAQTFTDYEIIVVDDGSTDETARVLAGYGDKVRYVHQNNAGQSAARNHGIGLAHGEYLAFLDADDTWLPQKLDKQVRFLDEHGEYDMVFADMSHCVDGAMIHKRYLHEKKYKFVAQGKIFNNLLREGFIFMPTVLVRRKCFEQVGVFDVTLSNCEDVDLWFRIADRFQIGFVDEPLAVRNVHGANVTHQQEDYLMAPLQLMEKLYRTNSDPERLAIIRRRLREMNFNLGYHYFSAYQLNLCRSHMLRSLALGGAMWPALRYVCLSLLPCSLVILMKNNRRHLTRG